MMKCFNKAISIFALLAFGATGTLAQSQLANGAFDTDIANWTASSPGVATLEWDGLTGSPAPGSLRISTTAPGPGPSGFAALSECIPAMPGSQWSLRARVREESGSLNMSCGLLFALHFNSDCSDPLGGVVSNSSAATTEWETLVDHLDFPTSDYQAFRVGLAMGTSTNSNGACNFDSVELLTSPNFAEVPTVDSAALAALAAALALAGLFWLRRSH